MLLVDSKVLNLIIPLLGDQDSQVRNIVLNTFNYLSKAFTVQNQVT